MHEKSFTTFPFVSITNDSSYVFPLTNYQASLLETRTAGDNTMVSEVIRQGDYKFLYRLRMDENALRRRNVTAKPTEFMKKVEEQQRIASGKASGTNTALWYQMNSNKTLVLMPFPTKSSTQSQKNCISKTNTVMKKVAMKGPIKALMTKMSNFFST